MNHPWEPQFRELYERTKSQLQKGEKDLARLFNDQDREFLKSIGSKPIEMFDAVDDAIRYGEPSFEDMLEIHRIRYEHFTKVQNGKFPPLTPDLRAKDAAIGGIPWLPRAIDKVRAKLEGRLVDDYFYPCAGDRKFLKQIGFTVPEFFKLVINTRSEDEIVAKIQSRKKEIAKV